MPPNTQPVCDSCRIRKTKCDRAVPCSTCVTCDLPCQYSHNLRRRGPKGGKGRRLALIKQGIANGRDDQGPQPAEQTFSPALSGISPGRLEQADNGPASPLLDGTQNKTHGLAAHVSIFMAHLFPVMPVVDAVRLEEDCASLDLISPSRYALLLALAAVTRIQLQLDQPEGGILPNAVRESVEHFGESESTGLDYLKAAEHARQHINIAESMSEDAIITSFFLFVCYGNREQHKQAWFYLNQSVSMAILLELDHETPESIAGLTELDMDKRRRIFWLLFISERTYALQRRMPILLRRTVPKPEVFNSDYPIIMNDFVNHVTLFESLPPALYDWQTESATSANIGGIGPKVIQALRSVQPQNSVLESQQFDTLITQNWLRVTMWRLAHGIASTMYINSTDMPGCNLPFEAGRSIMSSLTSVSNHSKNRHGISLEQKLFDIGVSLIDISPSTVASAISLGPQDLLGAIMNTLSCIRGRESHLLPKLLQHSQQSFELLGSGWGKDMQLSVYQPPRFSEEHTIEELPETGIFEILDNNEPNNIIYDGSEQGGILPTVLNGGPETDLYPPNLGW